MYTSRDSNTPYVLAIGTANPPHWALQKEVASRLASGLKLSKTATEKVHRIATGSCIYKRFTSLEPQDCSWCMDKGKKSASFLLRNSVYQKEAPKLALQACQNAISDWGGSINDITHIISVSCTGIMTPSLDFRLCQLLGLAPTVERWNVGMMGCFGGASGMKLATAVAAEDPNRRVLVICCELCSLHIQNDTRLDNIVGAMLFGDGAGAMIVGSRVRSYERPLFQILANSSYVIPGTVDHMGWELGATGWSVALHPSIPHHLGKHVVGFCDSLTAAGLGRKVNPGEMEWPVHPGGTAILQAIEDSCGLNEEEHTASSRQVLRHAGNMSSGTCYFVLDHLRTRRTTKEFSCLLAFGPGLNCEGILLRNCEAIKGTPLPLAKVPCPAQLGRDRVWAPGDNDKMYPCATSTEARELASKGLLQLEQLPAFAANSLKEFVPVVGMKEMGSLDVKMSNSSTGSTRSQTTENSSWGEVIVDNEDGKQDPDKHLDCLI